SVAAFMSASCCLNEFRPIIQIHRKLRKYPFLGFHMTVRLFRLTIFVIVIVSLEGLGPVRLQAQVGSIEGKVTDTSVAVIPGVQVSIRNVTSNETRLVVNSTGGVFWQPSLRPGTDTVKPSGACFSTSTCIFNFV